MKINDPIKVLGERRRQHEAMCCMSVASLLPGADNQQASAASGIRAEFSTSPCPVRPSNGPTDIDADARNIGQAATPPPAASNGHPDPDIARFYAEFRRGLPEEYRFNEEEQVIFEPLRLHWVCGPIRVASYPRRVDGSGWSVHVEYLDRDGRLGSHTFPQIELNTGRGKHVADLIDRGLAVHSEPFWTTRLLRAWEDVPHGWRVDAAGWFTDPDGMTSFVRADGRVHQPAGADLAPVVHASPANGRQAVSGNLEGWQKDVAAQALGNPALAFAISAALAGPLLRWSGIETAGFNIFGPSGIGKSLMLRLALSCGSAPSTLMAWNAAQTGLHRLSAQSQDGLLALDAFPRDPDSRHLKALLAIGDDAASGRILPARDPDGGERWRRLLLSTSELPLSTCLRRKKKEMPAALSTRIVDIAGHSAGHGLVTKLHGASDSRHFARRLEASMQHHHGHLIGLFLDRLVNDLAGIRVRLDDRLPELTCHFQKHCQAHAPASPACQSAVAERFALIAFAGELAIGFGLLPWPEGTARQAASAMAALAHPGPEVAAMEIEASLGLLRHYVSRHAHRIVDLAPDRPAETPRNAVGWRDEDHLYLQGEPIEQDLEDPDAFWNNLLEIDVLKPGGEQRSRQYKLPERKVRGRPRCYRVDRKTVDQSGPA